MFKRSTLIMSQRAEFKRSVTRTVCVCASAWVAEVPSTDCLANDTANCGWKMQKNRERRSFIRPLGICIWKYRPPCWGPCARVCVCARVCLRVRLIWICICLFIWCCVTVGDECVSLHLFIPFHSASVSLWDQQTPEYDSYVQHNILRSLQAPIDLLGRWIYYCRSDHGRWIWPTHQNRWDTTHVSNFIKPRNKNPHTSKPHVHTDIIATITLFSHNTCYNTQHNNEVRVIQRPHSSSIINSLIINAAAVWNFWSMALKRTPVFSSLRLIILCTKVFIYSSLLMFNNCLIKCSSTERKRDIKGGRGVIDSTR